MHWRAYVGNWASRRTAWRCGFRVEGTVRQLLVRERQAVRRLGRLPAQGRPDGAAPPLARRAGARGRAGAPAALARGRRAGHRPGAGRAGRRFLGGFVLTKESFDAWLTAQRSRIAEGEAVGWCIADVGTDRPLGHIHCFRLAQALTAGSAMVGYWLHPEGRGRGAVSEALELLVGHAFADPADGGLGLHRLEAGTDVDDVASARVLRRAGFTLIGTEHAMMAHDDGPPTDAALYELLASPTACPRVRRSAPVCWRGPRVRLRPWRQADDDRVLQACTDPVTRHWLGDLPSPYTEHDARSFLTGRPRTCATARRSPGAWLTR